MAPKRLLLLSSLCLALTACGGQRVKVTDAFRQRIGTLIVGGEASGVVYDGKRTRIGKLEGNQVFTKDGAYHGSVDDDGLIRDKAGELVGKFGNKQRCVDLRTTVQGQMEFEVAVKPGGAACLLLFFRHP